MLALKTCAVDNAGLIYVTLPFSAAACGKQQCYPTLAGLDANFLNGDLLARLHGKMVITAGCSSSLQACFRPTSKAEADGASSKGASGCQRQQEHRIHFSQLLRIKDGAGDPDAVTWLHPSIDTCFFSSAARIRCDQSSRRPCKCSGSRLATLSKIGLPAGD